MNSPGAPGRRVTRVAVGVLLREDGRVLLADRPAGKPYAGYWEFPGGKIEPGESVAVALERELHEELGIEIGPSTPWVTFEFEYPHAHVELQFRVVNRWRGEPHSREGQRLLFADPAAALPQPLLPAALPALRWLLLPRSVRVLAPDDIEAAGARIDPTDGIDSGRQSSIVVIEADWRNDGLASRAGWRSKAARLTRDWLMASGPSARRFEGWAGSVATLRDSADIGEGDPGWRGAWVDSGRDLQVAAGRGCDFVLVREAAVADVMQAGPVALPVFFPAAPSPATGQSCRVDFAHGCWTVLRAPATPAGAAKVPDR